MAIRINAAADAVNLTTGLPLNSAFTVIIDTQVVLDKGAGFHPLFFALNAGLTDGWNVLWDNGSNSFVIQVYDGGALLDSSFILTRPEIQKSFCLYAKCSGTGANQFEVGYKEPNTAMLRCSCAIAASVAQMDTLHFGGVAGAYWCDKRIKNARIWNRALSQQEIDVEMGSDTPVNTVGLNSYFPMDGVNDIFDRGPARKTLTRTGTMETEYFVYPRGKVGRKYLVAEPPAAPGGGTFQILAGRKFSLAGMAGLAGD